MPLAQAFLSITGPVFLLLYAVFITTVLFLLVYRRQALYWRESDTSGEPPGIREDRVRLAYVFGGPVHVFRTVGVHLLESGMLFLDSNSKVYDGGDIDRMVAQRLGTPRQEPQGATADLYASVLAYCRQNRTVLHPSPRLIHKIETTCESTFGREMYDAGLITSRVERQHLSRLTLIACAAFISVLALRLYTASLQHHHNVGFMILMCIGACYLAKICGRLSITTNRGQALLKNVGHFLTSANVSARVATLGLVALIGTEYALLYKSATAHARSFLWNGSGDGGDGGGGCGGGGCGGGCGG